MPVPNAVDPCVVGRWIITDMSPYFQSGLEYFQRTFEGISLTFEGSSGNGWYQFNQDGSVVIETVDFAQYVKGKFDVVEIPMAMFMKGVVYASYRTEDNKVIFSNPQENDFVFQIEIVGQRFDYPTGLLGDENGEEVVFLYECVGSNELRLTPPLNNYGVLPILLERDE